MTPSPTCSSPAGAPTQPRHRLAAPTPPHRRGHRRPAAVFAAVTAADDTAFATVFAADVTVFAPLATVLTAATVFFTTA